MSAVTSTNTARCWRQARYFKSCIKMVSRDGHAYTVDGGTGAALWLSPNKPGGGFFSRLKVPFVLWCLAGGKFVDVWSVIPLIERHRPQGPHWYLDGLGVNPAQGRKGIGTALLQHGLKRRDAAG